MRKKIIISIMVFIIFLNVNLISKAINEENTIDTNTVIESQADSIDIGSFLDKAQEYSTNILDDVDVKDILQDAISGNINSSNILKKILEELFKEVIVALESIGSIFVVILIHSILKNISDGLEDNSVSKIAYYVAYILIVTIIMKNFSDIINIIKTAIENLTGFTNCLFPILFTLLASSGGIKSAVMLQPIILFLITVIGNVITGLIIPFALISVALSVISNISDKIQIGKLSKFINSSTIWILGIILTIFVSVVSLDGSIAKRSRQCNS